MVVTMALHRGGVYDRSQHLGLDGERPFLCCLGMVSFLVVSRY